MLRELERYHQRNPPSSVGDRFHGAHGPLPHVILIGTKLVFAALVSIVPFALWEEKICSQYFAALNNVMDRVDNNEVGCKPASSIVIPSDCLPACLLSAAVVLIGLLLYISWANRHAFVELRHPGRWVPVSIRMVRASLFIHLARGRGLNSRALRQSRAG